MYTIGRCYLATALYVCRRIGYYKRLIVNRASNYLPVRRLEVKMI